MGTVFSCLASAFIYLGEFFENVFLAVGEMGAVLVRPCSASWSAFVIFFAAISCCYRVPWSERPDRSFYTYSTHSTKAVATSSSKALASVGGKQVLSSVFTKEGREQRKQVKAAKKKAAALHTEQVAAARSAKKVEEDQKKAKVEAQRQAAKADKEKAALKAKEEKTAAAAVKA